MLTPLTILKCLLVAEFGVRQTSHLSLGLTEAETCTAESLRHFL